jgi:hypothetical protein
MSKEATNLANANGGVWGEHPNYPVADWKHEIANDDTRLGYWDWVEHRLEEADFNLESLLRPTEPVMPELDEADQPAASWDEFEDRFGIVLFDAATEHAFDDQQDGDVLWQRLPDSLDPSHIWTVVEGEASDRWYVTPGLRRVNRVGYVVAIRPRSEAPEAYRDYLYDDD